MIYVLLGQSVTRWVRSIETIERAFKPWPFEWYTHSIDDFSMVRKRLPWLQRERRLNAESLSPLSAFLISNLVWRIGKIPSQRNYGALLSVPTCDLRGKAMTKRVKPLIIYYWCERHGDCTLGRGTLGERLFLGLLIFNLDGRFNITFGLSLGCSCPMLCVHTRWSESETIK